MTKKSEAFEEYETERNYTLEAAPTQVQERRADSMGGLAKRLQRSAWKARERGLRRSWELETALGFDGPNHVPFRCCQACEYRELKSGWGLTYCRS